MVPMSHVRVMFELHRGASLTIAPFAPIRLTRLGDLNYPGTLRRLPALVPDDGGLPEQFPFPDRLPLIWPILDDSVEETLQLLNLEEFTELLNVQKSMKINKTTAVQ